MVHEIRQLEREDVDDLQRLIESFPLYTERITGYPPGASDALSTLIGIPAGFDRRGKRGIGLWDDGELVAFADVLLGYPDPETAYVGLLLVHGDRQGEGLGRELHEAVLGRIRRESSARRIRLGIVETNASVRPFWSALGYAPTGETKPYTYDKLRSTVALWERSVDVARSGVSASAQCPGCAPAARQP